MAKRIMYSIIPAAMTPDQLAYTGGVDFKALEYAIEGRHDIIKYGAKACRKELRHYRSNKKIDLSSLSPERLVDRAIECFSDENGWDINYGGKAWEKIARSLKKIIDADNQLSALKEYKKLHPKGTWNGVPLMEAELNIMQALIIELNIFDGLSHNTASIMRNLIEIETAENTGGETWDHYEKVNEEYKKIMKMMDAKELANPIDVYKEIEETLVDSGDINRYKDWATKLKTAPDYLKHNPDKELEIFKIRFRKSTLNFRHVLREVIDNFKIIITELETFDGTKKSATLINSKYSDVMRKTYSAFSEIMWVADSFKEEYKKSNLEKLTEAIGVALKTFQTNIFETDKRVERIKDNMSYTETDYDIKPQSSEQLYNYSTLTPLVKSLLQAISTTLIYVDSV